VDTRGEKMRYSVIAATIGILILGNVFPATGYGDCFYQWKIEIRTGYVKGEVRIHVEDIDIATDYWELNFDRKWEGRIITMKAYETKTKKEVVIEVIKSREILQHFFIFEKRNPGDTIDVTVEFYIDNPYVQIMEGVDYFEWSWATGENFMRHPIDVVLPSGTEVVLVSDAVPHAIERDTIHFEEKSTGFGTKIKIGVAFSKAGRSYLEEAEKAFNSENFEESLSHYDDAIMFYESLGVLHGKGQEHFLNQLEEEYGVTITPTYLPFSSKADYDEFLKQLREKKAVCENKIEETKEAEADALFLEAQELFTSGDYEEAQYTFEKAQKTYELIGNDEKVSECQDYIDQCAAHGEKEQLTEKAEETFNQGITYYEQGKYDLAKITFQSALTMFTELDDKEKIEACNQWIASCSDALTPPENGSCLGTIIVVVLLGGILISKMAQPPKT
jgi:hypothetical protein